jgi:hypothetical protein
VRGPIIGTNRYHKYRNAIGAHGGSYCIYRGLAVRFFFHSIEEVLQWSPHGFVYLSCRLPRGLWTRCARDWGFSSRPYILLTDTFSPIMQDSFPNLAQTTPAAKIGPHPTWADPEKVPLPPPVALVVSALAALTIHLCAMDPDRL